MSKSRIESLAAKYRPLLALLAILFSLNGYAQYNPSVAGTTSNKPYATAQASPTDARTYYYDQTFFTWRPYQSTSEVLFYLNLAKYRTGQFDIVVNSGGTLSGGLITGGTNTIYYFKNGQADSNLVVKIGPSVDPSLFLLKANNLSDLPSVSTAKTTLGINNVDNTSDATKNAASVTLTNHTISGANNTITGLPNSALNNSSIGFTFGTSGTDFGFTGSPVPLGSSITLNFPVSGPGVTGKLSGTDWSTFNNKLSNITGLLTTGSGYTLNGLGTSASPYSLTITGGGGGSCLGCNADSLKNLPVDTTLRRNGYALTFDSTNHKWVLAPNGSGTGITALTGDGTASGSGTVAFTLATVNGSPGSFGSASSVPVFTVNGKGLVTTVTNTVIQIGESQVTNLTTDLASKISLTSLSATSPLAYNNSTGVFSIQVANTSQNGYLSSTDWNTFNGKQAALSGTGYSKFSGTTPSYLTPAQVTADLNLFTTSLQGLAPASGGGTTNFLRADGTWAIPPGTGGGSQNLTYTQLATTNNLAISGGNNVNFLLATHSLAGLMDSASKAVVDSIRLRTYSFPSFLLFAANGLTAAANDSFYWGGALNQPTTIATAGFNLSITGLPSKATALSTDSVLIENLAGQIFKLPVPSGGGGGGSVTAFSSGALSPLFTTSVANATTTPALSFSLSNAAANSVFGNNTGSSGSPSYFVPTATTLNGWFGGTIGTVTGAAGVTGNVQVNKLGAFGVVPGFNADTTYGYVGTNLIQGLKEVVAGDTTQLGTIGTIFSDNFNRSSLGANYTSSLSTFTLTFPSSSYLHATGTFSSFSNYIERTLPVNFVQDTLYATVVYQDTTSVSYGFGIAQVSQNAFYTRSVLMQFPAASSGTKGKSLVYLGDGSGFSTATFTSTLVLAFTIGDTIDIKAARNDSAITMIKKNRRTGLSTTDTYAYLSNNVTVTPPAQLPNQGKWRLYFFGGTFDILNFSSSSPDRTGGVVYVGNSILVGYNETNWSGRWVNYLHPSNRGIYDVVGGPGDRSAEYLNDTTILWLHNPKLVYWCGPENDCGASTSLTTFSANVVAFVNNVKAHNKPMVIVGGAPQTGKLMKPYNDTLQAIASRNNIPYINIYDTLRSGTDYNPAFSFDGVHPNTIGHIAVATQEAKQDPYFNYSVIRADNINNYVDVNSRYVFFSPTSPFGLTVGQKYRDSAIYFHQSPSSIDTGTVFATSLHIGAKPENTLNNTVSWIVGNGGTTSQIFAVQGLNAGDYPGMEMVDNSGNRTGFIYTANPSAAFNPGYVVLESNTFSKGIRFLAGLGTGRGSDFDMSIDSADVKVNHTFTLTNAVRKLLDTTNYKPAVFDASGNMFKTDWATFGSGGVTTVGTFSGSSQTNGASIAGSTITFGPADATNPGMVSTGTQTLAGNKTFTGQGVFNATSSSKLSTGSTTLQYTAIGSSGPAFNVSAATFQDATSSGTVGTTIFSSFIGVPTFSATNTVTYNGTIANFYISGPPAAGTNVTLSGSLFSLYVASGNTFLGGDVTTNHLIARGTSPTATLGTGAGTGATSSLAGVDQEGSVSVTVGTTPTAGATIVTMTYGTANFASNTFPVLTPANAATAALSGITAIYVTGSSTNFVITAGTAALTAGTTYKWYYHCGSN